MDVGASSSSSGSSSGSSGKTKLVKSSVEDVVVSKEASSGAEPEKKLGSFLPEVAPSGQQKSQPSGLSSVFAPILGSVSLLGSLSKAKQQDKAAVLVRTSAKDITTRMQQAATQGTTGLMKPALMLGGSAGVGKSVNVALSVAHARSQGWIAMYVPDAALVVNGSDIKTFDYGDEGEKIPPFFDTPKGATTILKNMLQAHGEQLDDMPIPNRPFKERFEFLGESFDELPAGASMDDVATLGSLVRWGVAEHGDATAALIRLRVMLPRLSTAPVLFAVDAYNALFAKTLESYNRTQLPPISLSGEARGATKGAPVRSRNEYAEELDERKNKAIWASQCRATWALRIAHEGAGPPPYTASDAPAEGGAPCVFHLAAWSQTARLASHISNAEARRGIADFAEQASIPRLTPSETRDLLRHYSDIGLLDTPPTETLASEWTILAGGSGKRLRELAETF
ncbi:ribosomal protein S29 [Pseudoscourfieldia marina]